MQNRVAAAMAQLPQSVQVQGVVVQQKSTAILQIVTLTSPKDTYDSLYLSNYATINLLNELARLPGRGQRQRLRRRPVRHADLARPGQALCPQPGAGGRHPGRSSSRTSRSPAARLGTPPAPPGQDFQLHRQRRGPAQRPRPVRQHHRQGRHRERRADHPHPRHRPRRAGRADLLAGLPARRQAGRRHRHLPVARRQRARRRHPGARQDGRAGQGFPAGSDLRHPLRHHRLRARPRSTRSTRR